MFLLALLSCAPSLLPQVPPPPALVLDVGFVVPGGPGSLGVTGANPGDTVMVGRGAPGAGPCLASLGGSCLGITSPQLILTLTADAAGEVSFAGVLPRSLPVGAELGFQAVVLGTGAVSQVVSRTVLPDSDGDGFGDATAGGDDCDELDAGVYPGSTSWSDMDADGFGDPAVPMIASGCGLPPGFAANDGDCDDGAASIHVGAAEIRGDNLDQDCDGTDIPAWIQLDFGGDQGCGALSNGDMRCWGRYHDVYAPPWELEAVRSSISNDDGCYIDHDTTLWCWGGSSGALGIPTGTSGWVDVTRGSSHGCALSDAGAVTCWGYNSHGQTTPPAETFTGLDAGSSHQCAQRGDGTLACWGYDDNGQASPPQIAFDDYSVGFFHGCGLVGTDMTCWGRNGDGQTTIPSGHLWTDVAASVTATCGLTDGGEILCWGEDLQGQLDAPSGTFVELHPLTRGFCAEDAMGRLACWGWSGQAMAPVGDDWVSVDVGSSSLCGITEGGELVCTGPSELSTTPEGVFVDVETADGVSCGLTDSGVARCWGYDTQGELALDGETAIAVGVGQGFACIVEPSGEVRCAGEDLGGQLSPAPGPFVDVDGGGYHACGLRPDNTAACWGWNNDGQTTVPAGRYQTVQAGLRFTCGLKLDGTLDCWGRSAGGATRPPSGVFTQLDVGNFGSCALRQDGEVECWASSGYGSPAPAGPFVDLGAWDERRCGVRANGSVACWGSQVVPELPRVDVSGL